MSNIIIEVQPPSNPVQVEISIDAKANSSSEVLQNNIARIISLGYAFGNVNEDSVVNILNARTTVISATDSPVILTFKSLPVMVGEAPPRKYAFVFTPGKGKYGVNGITVTATMLYQWSVSNVVIGDIDPQYIFPLGEVEEGGFLEAANQDFHVFTNPDLEYYFSYYTESILYIALFKGVPGSYGGESLFQFSINDFAIVTDSNVLPAATHTSQLINDGANGTDPFTTVTALAAVEENAVKKTGSLLQTIIGDIVIKGKLFIQGVGSILDGSTVNAFFKKITSTENIEINTALPTLPNHAIRKDFAEGLVNGMTLSVNQATAEMYLKNSTGTTLATLNLGFLNNEGTTFFYNETTQKLELKNDAGEILSEVPVSAFVSNLMQSVNFNGATPSILEFKDASGALVDSVTITINNVAGLQEAFNGKANKDGTNATGTWPVNVTGNSGSATNWGGSTADFSTDASGLNRAVGLDASNNAKRYTTSSFKLWLAIAITDVSGLATSLAEFATSLAGKANTNGSNSTGTWPIHVTGNAGNSLLWNSMPINLSVVSPSTDYLLGNKDGGGVLMNTSGVKLWLAIAITDVLGLATTLAGYATSLAGKANLTGGNSFSGNQNITGLLDVNGDINLGSGRNITWGGRYIDGNPTIAANSAGIGFYPSGGDTAMYITAARAIGIGKDNPKYKFDTNGIGRFKREGVNGAGLVGVLIAASDSKTVNDGVLQAFQGLNQANEEVSYGSVAAFIESSSTGAHSGKLEFRTYHNAIAILALKLNKDGSAKFYGEVEVPAGTAPGSAINKQQLDNAVFSARPYKVYTATMTQTGTAAPVAVVLENTIGDIAWSYNLGRYNGTLSGAFPANKVAFFVTKIENYFDAITHVKIKNINDGTIEISTCNASNISTNGILNAVIEIRVYN